MSFTISIGKKLAPMCCVIPPTSLDCTAVPASDQEEKFFPSLHDPTLQLLAVYVHLTKNDF
jgi:hypothetical protein